MVEEGAGLMGPEKSERHEEMEMEAPVSMTMGGSGSEVDLD